MMRPSQPILTKGVVTLLGLACVSCASGPERAGYEAFLNTIAEECKPLMIGSDNLGQAIIFNGVGGADPDHYHKFLSQTKGLYYGSTPPTIYRNSLTAVLGGGPYNDRSFECIVAHVPRS
jgi:hypothetical protein